MSKIEAGKTYQTRGGQTAIIDAVDCKFSCGATILGRVILDDGTHRIFTWNADGEYFKKDEHYNDLIIPPKRESRWVNWYVKHAAGICYETREEADASAGLDRTHVLEIITEDGKLVDVKIHEVGK